MKTKLSMKLSLAAILLAICASSSTAAAARAVAADDDDDVIGWIVPVSRKTFFERDSPQGKESLTLIPRRDNGLPLRGGDRVRCEPGGRMKINIYGTETEVAGSNDWQEIPHLPPPNDSVRRAIEQYAHLGGRTRPGGQEVLSPAKESKVSLARLLFRWVPRNGNVFLSVANPATGEQLWEQTQIPGAAGRLDSAEARARLAAFRDRGGVGTLSVTLGGGGRAPSVVTFELLTAGEETQLTAELATIDTDTTGVLRNMGRAAVFDKFGMRAQVAEEYDAALMLDPTNVHLLVNTAVAYEAIGDSRRVQALKRRLPRGVNLPAPGSGQPGAPAAP